MQVLIVDSSVQIIERLQQSLAEMEHVSIVYGAVAFKDGLEFFRAVLPAVVLIDSRLKDNTCIRLIEEMRKADTNTSIIVMLNGEDDLLQEKIKISGADMFFDKYHDFENIPATVNLLTAEKREGNINGIR